MPWRSNGCSSRMRIRVFGGVFPADDIRTWRVVLPVRECLCQVRKFLVGKHVLAAVWLQLARAENALGHTEATLTAVGKAAQVSPQSGSAFAILGFSYINLNRIQQAIPPLQRAAKLLPQYYLRPSAARILPSDHRTNSSSNRIPAERSNPERQLWSGLGAPWRGI